MPTDMTLQAVVRSLREESEQGNRELKDALEFTIRSISDDGTSDMAEIVPQAAACAAQMDSLHPVVKPALVHGMLYRKVQCGIRYCTDYVCSTH